MAKFLLTTDWHIRLNSPRSRKDDISNVFLYKINMLKQIIISENIDYVLMAGDLLDRSNTNTETLLFAEELLKIIEIPIITILGNHCLKGNVLTNYKTSSINILNKICNNLIIPVHDMYMDIDNVRLYFNHYGNDNFMIDNIDNTKVNIIITHSSILENEEMFKCIKAESILTNADFIFTGHIHSKFKVGKIYNPGALIRITTSKGDMDREVEVGILDVNNKELKLDKINLDIKHFSEVFDINTVKKKVEKLNESMLDNINKRISSILSVQEVFSLVTKDKNLNEDVLSCVNEYIV